MKSNEAERWKEVRSFWAPEVFLKILEISQRLVRILI